MISLHYPDKKTIEAILAETIPPATLPIPKAPPFLLHGENGYWLRQLLNHPSYHGKIDLIYLDPPYATNQVFQISENRSSTISRSKNGKTAYSDTLTGAHFLEFLRERLILLRELLSEAGSIYLHIDYKIGHYVKIIMDEIFGIENFRNDITRIKCNPKNFARKGYGNIKDLILFYSKGANPIWNEPKQPYTPEDEIKLFPKKEANGRRYTTIPLHAPGETANGATSQPFLGITPPPGRHWRTDITTLEQWNNNGLIEWSDNGNPRKKIYLDEQQGKRIQDIWEFKDPQYPVYPTEKNERLLDLIVKTSSLSESIVLDPFCGSGTALVAAQNNNRQWIGIDQSDEAIRVTEQRLRSSESDLFSANMTNFQIITT